VFRDSTRFYASKPILEDSIYYYNRLHLQTYAKTHIIYRIIFPDYCSRFSEQFYYRFPVKSLPRCNSLQTLHEMSLKTIIHYSDCIIMHNVPMCYSYKCYST